MTSQDHSPVGTTKAAELVRVACITHDGTTYVLPSVGWQDAIPEIADDQNVDERVFTITFKNMERADFDALGEFDGF